MIWQRVNAFFFLSKGCENENRKWLNGKSKKERKKRAEQWVREKKFFFFLISKMLSNSVVINTRKEVNITSPHFFLLYELSLTFSISLSLSDFHFLSLFLFILLTRLNVFTRWVNSIIEQSYIYLISVKDFFLSNFILFIYWFYLLVPR